MDTDEGRYVFVDGKIQTGWQVVGGRKYWCGDDGKVRTGWHTVDGVKYYFEGSGAAAAGVMNTDSGRYVFADGIIQTGWQNSGGRRYYCGDDGIVRTGWQTIDGARYFFEGSGAAARGLVDTGSGRYIFSEGSPLTGWQSLGGRRYYCGSDGVVRTGWQDLDARYYFEPSGALAEGFANVDGSRYYFTGGRPVTGWQILGGKRYLFYDDGRMAVNTSAVAENGETYNMGSDGVAHNANPFHEALDNLLNRYGRSQTDIYNAVRKTVRYKWAPRGASMEETAAYAINHGSGACWHFASLGYCLYQYAGYDVRYIEGTGRASDGSSEHHWLYVRYPDGWFYVDPVYANASRLTEADLHRYGYKWDASVLPTN